MEWSMAMPHKTDIKSLNYNELVQYVESINEKNSELPSYIRGCTRNWQKVMMR